MPNATHEVVWTIVVAGGSGDRFGTLKQYEELGAERVIDRSVRIARRASDGIVIVVPAADVEAEGGVAGGATRAESTRNGLAVVPDEATIICVHDAARPLATTDLYASVVGAVAAGADGAIPGIAVSDTIKRIGSGGDVLETPDRASLVAVQTPQAFRASVLREAHRTGAEGTDDSSLVEAIGGRVVVVLGSSLNRKITQPEDLVWARSIVASGTV